VWSLVGIRGYGRYIRSLRPNEIMIYGNGEIVASISTAMELFPAAPIWSVCIRTTEIWQSYYNVNVAMSIMYTDSIRPAACLTSIDFDPSFHQCQSFPNVRYPMQTHTIAHLYPNIVIFLHNITYHHNRSCRKANTVSAKSHWQDGEVFDCCTLSQSGARSF
jgi:hypothetical protein